MKKGIVCAVGFLLVVGAQAETISLNFVGNVGGGTLGASGQAGLIGNEIGNSLGSTMVANWNNLSGNIGSGVGGIMHSGGAVVDGASVSWGADNTWSLPNTTGGANVSANTTMMKGYLDNASESTTSITVSGLEVLSGSYSVIVFIDGNNEANWTRGSYTIGGSSVVNEDSENVDFNSGSGNNANGLFQIPSPGGIGNQAWPFSPNNSEGNMIIFSGLTGSSFTLTATPGDATDMNVQRAPINGIQVVGVIPEPATMGLVALFGGGVFLVRRFFQI